MAPCAQDHRDTYTKVSVGNCEPGGLSALLPIYQLIFSRKKEPISCANIRREPLTTSDRQSVCKNTESLPRINSHSHQPPNYGSRSLVTYARDKGEVNGRPSAVKQIDSAAVQLFAGRAIMHLQGCSNFLSIPLNSCRADGIGRRFCMPTTGGYDHAPIDQL